MPVQPISYISAHSVGGRPGGITTIGVLSVVLACLSLFTGLASGMWSFAILTISLAQSRAQAVPMVQASPNGPISNATTPVAETIGPRGMPLSQRQLMIAGLSRTQPLSPGRKAQVDELLIEYGTDVIALSGNDLTSDAVAANVSSSGQLPTADGSSNGTQFFTLGQGRLEVGDDHAVFFPADGSAALRTTAPFVSADSSPAIPGTHSLTAGQQLAVLRRIKFLGASPNPAQSAAITQTLQNPGQQFVVPDPMMPDVSLQISSAASMSDGSLNLSAAHGNSFSNMVFAPSGQITQSSTSNFAGGRNAMGMMPHVNRSLAIASLTGVLVNLGLAIFLLISGIFMLRQSPIAPKMHWIYVWMKIPMVLLTAAVGMSVSMQFFGSLPGGRSASQLPWVVMFTTAMPAVIAIAYPIALIFLLRSKPVREYFAAVV